MEQEKISKSKWQNEIKLVEIKKKQNKNEDDYQNSSYELTNLQYKYDSWLHKKNAKKEPQDIFKKQLDLVKSQEQLDSLRQESLILHSERVKLEEENELLEEQLNKAELRLNCSRSSSFDFFSVKSDVRTRCSSLVSDTSWSFYDAYSETDENLDTEELFPLDDCPSVAR